MNNKLKMQLELLKNSVLSEDFLNIAYDITEVIEEYEDGFDAVEPILRILEQNPNVDFGSPGPLVHFVERFYRKGYEEKLVQSIQRLPTSHTVWMLNRIINGTEGEKKKYYIDILQNVLKYPDVSNDLNSFTKEILSQHN